MNKHKIRLSKTNSINSINSKEIIGVNLKRTSKLFPDLNVVGEVDAYEVFQSEKANCNNYRLILTINPFCTNVLFNDLTEITRNEGSGNDDVTAVDGIECITDYNTPEEKNNLSNEKHAQYLVNSKFKEYEDYYGLQQPLRLEMIMNTEYSKESIGYEYKPGYDIFTNHILRNTTYKVVNMLDERVIPKSMQNNGIVDDFCSNEIYNEGNLPQQSELEYCKRVFNTIGDFMRYSDGTVVMYRKREQIGADVSDELNKHLYLYDEVLSMEDSINNNLTEENGWFGFVNNSTISSKKHTTNTNPITNRHIWEDLDINRVLNNKENCEFIDMYPDRSLFSFNPKLNKFRKRLEYNWNIVLTYPYRNEYCHKIVTSDDGKTNGLLLMSITKTLNSSGTNILLFRSFCKHGLKQGDMINLYANGIRLSRSIKVTNVGNMSSDNDDNALYYFYSTDMTLLYEYFNINIDTETNTWVDENGTELTTNNINEFLKTITEYRIRKISSGVESEYYIRVFRKLPNLKNKKENLTEEIAEDRKRFENYIYGNGEFENKPNAAETIQNSNNGSFDEYMIDFNSEQYKLAFNRTIYNDASTQITYTDTINTEYLVDNLGRPLHEIYATVIKNNKGYKKWYGIDDGSNTETNNDIILYEKYKYEEGLRKEWQKDENIEFSHCFGRLTSGFEFSNEYNDRNNKDIITNKAKIGDITTLNELEIFEAKPFEVNIDTHGTYAYEQHSNNNYILQKDEFYGDIVEFNPIQAQEYVLLPICYRFNTAQRELPGDNGIFNKFIYQEIGRDDFDPGEGMEVIDTLIKSEYEVANGIGGKLKEWRRPEGYFYQAHYQIPFMEFGQVNQDAHYDIKVKAAQPAQMDGIYIKITTPLKQTISTDDIIYVCLDDEENYRNDKWYEFVVSYVENKYTFYIHPYNMTWKDFTNKVNDKYNWVTLAMAFTAENVTNEDGTISYKNVKLRRRNEAIPKYATKVAHNKYLWRDLYRPGEILDGELEELPYTNNAFYISKEINFFLKRQDPYGISGLYCSNAVINDVKGNQREEDTYYYKDENEVVC